VIDLAIVFLYLLVIFLVAFLSRRSEVEGHQSDEDIVNEQYLAGRSLSLIESMGSIIATEVSALTFIGIPAFAFTKDFSFLHFYIGAIFGRLLIAKYIIPKIYGKGLTLYAIMGSRDSSENGMRFSALIYSVSKLLAVGVRLYAGSILVAEYFNVSIYFALILITALTFAYTLIGGLKAVVRTDLLQTLLFVGGGLIAHFLIPDISGHPWTELYSIAKNDGHTWILSWDKISLFLIGVSGGVLFDMCTHGVDQDFTQRLMGAKSERVAKFSIFFSSFFSIGVGFLFLSIGALLYGHYQLHPLPIGAEGDKVFAHFITNYFPSPLKGLMLAGVLAATMSTLDSTINALSSVLWSEIWPHRDVHKIKTYLKIDTLIISLALLAIAFLASTSEGVLVLGLKVASWSGGALAALFFSQLIWPNMMKVRLDGTSVIVAYLGNLALLVVNTYVIEGPWQWNVYWGMIGASLALFIRKAFLKTS